MRTAKRFWEIDFFRGLAVILMVVFNYSFTLHYFNVYTVEGGWFYWYLFPRIIGGMFIFIAGLSVMISYNRIRKRKSYKKYLRRGLGIFSLGLGITVVTWILFPKYTILFGILHLIGLSIMVSPFFFRLKYLNLIFGLLLIAVGIYLQNFVSNFPWLLWLVTEEFATFDYWPMIPWFGVFLIGMFFSSIFYEKIKRKPSIKNNSKLVINPICYLGRNSLVIYLIHQPILVAFLYFFAGINII